MIANPCYSQQGHGPYELYNIGDLDPEEGGTLRDCQLAVVTHGKLNAAKDNAILVPPVHAAASSATSSFSTKADPVYAFMRGGCLGRDRLNYTTTGNPKGIVTHHRGAYLNAARQSWRRSSRCLSA
jgi:hypothetical protein